MGAHRAQFPDNSYRSTDEHYYDWKIYQNPYIKGEIYLEIRDGIIVGSSTITPKRISIVGHKSFAAELGDSFTLPRYQRQGINSRALAYCTDYGLSHGINIIYGTPNEANYRLLIKQGYIPCSYVSFARMEKSLRPFSSLRAAVRALIFGHRKSTLQLLKLMAAAELRYRRATHSRHGCDSGDIQIETLDNIPEDINDGFWGRPRYGFFNIRDSSYLRWRFFHNPNNYLFLAAHKYYSWSGYLVAKTSKDNQAALFCDFATFNDALDIFAKLIRRSEQLLAEMGIKRIALSCVKNSPYYQSLLDSGYFDMGSRSNQPILVYSKTAEGKRILENRSKWHFTLADTDAV